jgi:hypothetical protein
LLRFFFGMFRNTTAHAPRIEWETKELDALDIMSLASLCHRWLDQAKKIEFMEQYYHLISEVLLNRLGQIRQFIKKHNPTIGLLTESVLREFLKEHLPKKVSVEQGFIQSLTGEISKQCDILIYDSQNYAPFYRINDVVIIPEAAVIAVIEVKTVMNKVIFKDTVVYFENIRKITLANTYLFIFNAPDIHQVGDLFLKYKHPGAYQLFDHDTFQYLPDEITGLSNSFHLKKSYITINRDAIGYDSWFFENHEGTEIGALQNFLTSINDAIEHYVNGPQNRNLAYMSRPKPAHSLKSYQAFELFDA